MKKKLLLASIRKPRVLIRFNTGTRVEKQKRGTGSYSRRDKYRKYFSFSI